MRPAQPHPGSLVPQRGLHLCVADSDSQCSPTRQSLSLSEGEEQMDRLQQVELVRTTPMSHWKAGTVQAWLEVVMAMPMYVKACAENVKSGKVLLGLSDEDLQLGLGVCSSLHRRKLRLAIEDYRDAEAGRSLSKAAELDHHWVAKAWLNDIGLSQYSQAFQNHLVDGRMLNSLMKRDLEKHLNVSKKFHQVSILLGIELLYQVNFSREALQERRARCETQNTDPVVWTNQRVLKWVRDIDLKEYADNLTNSGVHGAVLVLEPTFNAEAMATALGIPSGKHILRRHLAEEMSAVFHPANSTGIREAERFGTPPGRASSATRAGKEENSSGLKYKAGRLPLGKIGRGFSSKDPDFHDDYGSLQNEDCGDDDPQSRLEQCRLEGYNSLEVTNVPITRDPGRKSSQMAPGVIPTVHSGHRLRMSPAPGQNPNGLCSFSCTAPGKEDTSPPALAMDFPAQLEIGPEDPSQCPAPPPSRIRRLLLRVAVTVEQPSSPWSLKLSCQGGRRPTVSQNTLLEGAGGTPTPHPSAQCTGSARSRQSRVQEGLPLAKTSDGGWGVSAAASLPSLTKNLGSDLAP
ncbi:LOW QUALITY PROTEIN: Kazrin [Plecturocebus cupreus]